MKVQNSKVSVITNSEELGQRLVNNNISDNIWSAVPSTLIFLPSLYYAVFNVRISVLSAVLCYVGRQPFGNVCFTVPMTVFLLSRPASADISSALQSTKLRRYKSSLFVRRRKFQTVCLPARSSYQYFGLCWLRDGMAQSEPGFSEVGNRQMNAV